MPASIVSSNREKIVLQIEIPIEAGNMLDLENSLQKTLNDAGQLGAQELLGLFEPANKEPIVVNKQKWSYKGKVLKHYESMYGKIPFKRSVYQGVRGGVTLSPLDIDAGIVGSATPKFAKSLAWKYSQMPAPAVKEDFEANHQRTLSNSYIKHLSDRVGALIEEHSDADHDYDLPQLDKPVSTVAIGLDGTCMLLCEEGWREAMCGTLSLYSADGDRLHTIYIGSAPEYGKESFLTKLNDEITALKQKYPQVTYIGVADGAKENWRFLKQHTSGQILDFYHASEYLGGVAEALFPTSKAKRKLWLEDRLHCLKHKRGGAKKILHEIESAELPKKTTALIEKRYKAVTYFTNNHQLMNYHQAIKRHWTIGSGVTEAACKTLVKQRLCSSGMRWKATGAEVLLNTRSLIQSKGRWEQLWTNILSGKQKVDL
ncbi:ISKra4 family transposase [Endozoicomonas ascidiicola]|uniref:ISKra4 family transposase n=1 Tax=Endozoicomonas ascidiicola TaxID=1698521 RepID=UPI00082D817A|nr:ISKra4 family transposase [Endozoicomonas ascidiicola]